MRFELPGITLDVLMLSECDYFIGHADSAVTRLGYCEPQPHCSALLTPTPTL